VRHDVCIVDVSSHGGMSNRGTDNWGATGPESFMGSPMSVGEIEALQREIPFVNRPADLSGAALAGAGFLAGGGAAGASAISRALEGSKTAAERLAKSRMPRRAGTSKAAKVIQAQGAQFAPFRRSSVAQQRQNFGNFLTQGRPGGTSLF